MDDGKIDWIANLKNNPNETLKLIYKNHRDNCKNWIQNNCKFLDDTADDIFQESIIVFFEKVRDGKLMVLENELSTYLFAIAKYIAIKHKKEAKDLLVDNSKIEQLARNWVVEENTEDLSPRQEVMLAKLEQLKDPCRTILYSYYYKNMDMKSIAETLDYKSGTIVKAQKYRCVKQFVKY